MNQKITDRRGPFNLGFVFIILGMFWLLNEIVPFETGPLVLPLLAAVFLVWGVSARQSGLLIPGGVLAGIAAGNYLQSALNLEAEAGGGLVVMSMAAGWFLILLLSALFTDCTLWWALWPGTIMTFIGAALLIGGPALTLLSFVGRFWPVILIVIGFSILLKRRVPFG